MSYDPYLILFVVLWIAIGIGAILGDHHALGDVPPPDKKDQACSEEAKQDEF